MISINSGFRGRLVNFSVYMAYLRDFGTFLWIVAHFLKGFFGLFVVVKAKQLKRVNGQWIVKSSMNLREKCPDLNVPAQQQM